MNNITQYHQRKLLSVYTHSSDMMNDSSCLNNILTIAFICTYNNDYTFKFISDSFNNLGYTFSEISSHENNLKDILTEKSLGILKNLIEYNKSIHIQDFICDLEIRTNYNSIKYFRCNISLNFYSNSVTSFECVGIDITDIKKQKADIKRLSSIISSTENVFLQVSVDDNYCFTTDFCSKNIKYFNINPNKLYNKSLDLFNLIDINECDEFIKSLHDMTPQSPYCVITTKLCITKESSLWVMIEMTATFEDNKIKSIFTVIHNINTQKEAFQNLADREKKLSTSLRHSELIAGILKLLQNTTEYDVSLKIIMQRLAEYASLSKIFLYVPQDNSPNFYMVYEYENSTANFTIEYKNDAEKYSHCKNIRERLDQYGTVYYDCFGASANCYEEFKSLGEFSCILYTVFLTDIKNGYFCCIDNDRKRSWDSDIIEVLNDISQILISIFKNFIIKSQLSKTKDMFQTVLDNLDAYILASEKKTNKIIFSNKKINTALCQDVKGKMLWDVLDVLDSKSQCRLLDYTNDSKTKTYELYCPKLKMWLDISETEIYWNDGQLVNLCTMTDITKKNEYEMLVENQANIDHLTSLPNRRMLEKEFPKLLKETLNNNTFGYVLFLDLDNFKNVNDGLGHQYGDNLLQTISAFLKELPFGKNRVYRFGGDEFLIIIDEKHADNINDIINTLLERFRQPWLIYDTNYYCTMSMGIAKFPYDGYNIFDIMKKVDMAMYNAKKNGKNRYIHYINRIGFDSIRTIELERYLRENISDNFNGFEVYFQPTVNAKSKNIIGAEALLRWENSNIGSITPSEFIPLAERTGLIIELGKFVLEKSCTECKRWINQGYENFKININLSVTQLNEKTIVSDIINTIKKVGIPFSNVGLEITESIAINDMHRMKKILTELSDLGINILLDDFGVGYSSLNCIKELPLNIIKIDKSFIQDLGDKKTTETFIKTIIDMAHVFNMQVCAEGVEQEAQYQKLLNMNTDIIQGYYFGKPIPPTEFKKFLYL